MTKKIMIITDSTDREKANRLKLQLEKRQIVDVVDVSSTSSTPQNILEELILKKGLEEYDYRMFIVNELVDSPGFTFCHELRRNFPKTHQIYNTYT